MSAALIEARGIVKRFGALTANEVEHFDVRPGEVHGLLGENGAGKSTLCKILYGYHQPDAGEIRVDGERAAIGSPAEARARGIGMVFQDFTLVPALSVFENLVLFMRDVPAMLERRALRERIGAAAAALGMSLPLEVPAGALSAGEQQKVEILKQVLAGMRVLILDEPTKVLAPQECAGLFAMMGELRALGYGIVFITHKLGEVLEAADRISVMRKGRIVGVLERTDATEARLLALMFEAAVPVEIGKRAPRAAGRMALELRDASTPDEAHGVRLEGISLSVREGEIVGIAGIAGSGQRELGALIVGKARPSRGSKHLWDDDAGHWPIKRVRRAGVGFVPESPLEMACIGPLSVAENFALGWYADWRSIRGEVAAAFARLDFPCPPLDASVGTLSGGNVQRVVMARELGRGPRIVVALHPTRGLDVRSAQAVRERLRACAEGGAAVLVMSEELDELFGLCDHLVVLRRGRIAARFEPPDFASERVGAAMVGGQAHAH